MKMHRSPWTLIFGVCFNLTTMLIYYIFISEKTHGTEDILLDKIHQVCWWTSIPILMVCIPLFIMTVAMEPGYLKPFYDYIKLVEVALEIGLHLDNFCSYCEVIKSETSFHCTICNRCIESFDHHCPFVNNCLGHRNHKYFLSFIFLYSIFLLLMLFGTLRHFVEIWMEVGWTCIYTDSMTTVNVILITLHIPVFVFQWRS